MSSPVKKSATVLTKEQESFLEECALEFSDRFTHADMEYQKIYEAGVPKPPIMFPWHTRNRFVRDRDRGGGDGRTYERYERDHDRRSYNDRRYRPY